MRPIDAGHRPGNFPAGRPQARRLPSWPAVAGLMAILLTASYCRKPADERETPSGPDPFVHGVSLVRRLDTQAVHRRVDTQAAVEALGEARQLYPERAEVHFYLGRAFELDTKLAAAEKAYGEAVRLDPSLSEGWLRLLQIAIAHGRLDDAWMYAERCEAEWEGKVSLDFQKGLVLSRMGRLEEADERLKRSVQVSPNRPEAWYNLGLNSLRRQRLSEAAEAFSRALELDGMYAEAWFNLGNTLVRLGRENEAEDALTRFAAVKRARDEQAAMERRLQVLRRGAQEDLQAGRLAKAERQIREAEEIDPGRAWAGRLHGELLLAMGHREESLVYLHRAASLNSPEPEEHLALAEAFRLAREDSAAARQEDEAQRLLEVEAP